MREQAPRDAADQARRQIGDYGTRRSEALRLLDDPRRSIDPAVAGVAQPRSGAPGVAHQEASVERARRRKLDERGDGRPSRVLWPSARDGVTQRGEQVVSQRLERRQEARFAVAELVVESRA